MPLKAPRPISRTVMPHEWNRRATAASIASAWWRLRSRLQRREPCRHTSTCSEVIVGLSTGTGTGRRACREGRASRAQALGELQDDRFMYMRGFRDLDVTNVRSSTWTCPRFRSSRTLGSSLKELQPAQSLVDVGADIAGHVASLSGHGERSRLVCRRTSSRRHRMGRVTSTERSRVMVAASHDSSSSMGRGRLPACQFKKPSRIPVEHPANPGPPVGEQVGSFESEIFLVHREP
jgi:hypothetical protein